jgi:hypothetical protein
MWYDLGPLRPEEYLDTRADTWTEAVQLRNAALDGINAAKAEAAGYQRLAEVPNPGEVG